MSYETLAVVILIIGILLLHFFPVYTDPKTCEGTVKYEGFVLKVFISKKGNRIGVLENALAIVPEWVEKGDRIIVVGKGSKYGKTCFIFPEMVWYAGY